VPIGSRKPVPVVLDDDKVKFRAEMTAKDSATVKTMTAEMPSMRSGYRFANHPLTMGPVRGPDPPFLGATSPWRPPSADPYGPAAHKSIREHAPVGGYKEGSHSFNAETIRKSRSLPTLRGEALAEAINENALEEAKLAANPISIELNRWKRLAKSCEGREVASFPTLHKRIPPPIEKPGPVTGGLVNFPKYTLFENCNLKNMENRRFMENQERERKAAEERLAIIEATGQDPMTPILASMNTTAMSSVDRQIGESAVPYGSASWGQPRLRGTILERNWAGSAMPGGRGSKTSNPFRMG